MISGRCELSFLWECGAAWVYSWGFVSGWEVRGIIVVKFFEVTVGSGMANPFFGSFPEYGRVVSLSESDSESGVESESGKEAGAGGVRSDDESVSVVGEERESAVDSGTEGGGRSVGKNGIGKVDGEGGSVSGGDRKGDGVRSNLSIGFAGLNGRRDEEKSESTLPLYSGGSVVDGRIEGVKDVVCTEVVGEDVLRAPCCAHKVDEMMSMLGSILKVVEENGRVVEKLNGMMVRMSMSGVSGGDIESIRSGRSRRSGCSVEGFCEVHGRVHSGRRRRHEGSGKKKEGDGKKDGKKGVEKGDGKLNDKDVEVKTRVRVLGKGYTYDRIVRRGGGG